MRKFLLATIFCTLSLCAAQAQAYLPAYTLFTGDGSMARFDEMIADMAGADVVFIGEYHNNPISHWMEYEITSALIEARGGKVTLGAEMFEADCQLLIDEYLAGTISTTRFEADCRMWHNYETDYEPLMSLAHEHGLRFIATNIPRRYASMVNQRGGDEALLTLSVEAKRYMAPLPMPLKSDSVMLGEGGIMSLISENPLAVAKAQAVKDATMAWFIDRNLEEGGLFIHYNGSYHSDFHDGIVYFLNEYRPGVKVCTFSTVQQDEIDRLDLESYEGIADYVICVPYSMTRTY